MVIFTKTDILILHTLGNAKLKLQSKFEQKRMIFHRDIAKIRKTKEISANSLWKTKEIKKRTIEKSAKTLIETI